MQRLTAKELRLKQIHARFRAATPRRFRRRRQPSVPTVLICVTVVSAFGALVLAQRSSQDAPALAAMTTKDRVLHLLASPNCTAARLVGLAPATRDEPGYWDRHDADHDGVACEPFVR